MRLYEYEAKEVFSLMGIPIPKQYGIIHSSKELDEMEVEFPIMLKSLVLVGGRGKAGGIKKATNAEEAKRMAKELFAMDIKGYRVETILIEKAIEEQS
jgi:succinyl-CoA synthetase beta subunit